jgi:hypothetical protein
VHHRYCPLEAGSGTLRPAGVQPFSVLHCGTGPFAYVQAQGLRTWCAGPGHLAGAVCVSINVGQRRQVPPEQSYHSLCGGDETQEQWKVSTLCNRQAIAEKQLIFVSDRRRECRGACPAAFGLA